MKMEVCVWVLWLYCLCYTSAYTTPSYGATDIPLYKTTDDLLCPNASLNISSPGYPNRYKDNMEYRWTFRTRYLGSLFSIKFNHFDIEENYDYVLIFSDGEQIGSYTGSEIPSTVSAKAPLTVIFQSDYLVTASGFEAEISGSDGICSDFDDGWSGWNPYPVSSSSYQSWKRSSEKITGDDTNRYSVSEYYSYIESSSGNSQRYGYLESTEIPTTWSDGCIEFYYYMNGNAVQYLYVQHYIGSSGTNLMYLYYYLGTGWQYGRVQFTNGSPPNKIRFYGRVDHGSTGSKTILAIDDVYISEGKCPPITDGTCFGYQPLMSSSENLVGNDSNSYTVSDGICSDFDDGWTGLNPYPYSSSNYQSWKRSSGKLTGDDTNRYSGSGGYYAYVQSSSGNSQPYGYLESAGLPTTWSDGCIEFYYYMNGHGSQFLDVFHYISSSTKFLMGLYYSGTGWQYGRAQFIGVSSTNKIRFKAYVVHGSTGSTTILAIDDVYISEGKCSHTQDATVPPTRSNINLSTLQDERTTSPSMESKLNVICSDSYMTVYLDSSISKGDNVHFLDPACTAAGIVYRNDSRLIYLYTRYDQCQTIMTSTLWSTTYRNQVIVSTHTNYEIYRKEDLHFTIECEVKNRGKAAVAFAPEGAGEDYLKRESGNLTFTMALFTNDSYSTPYSSWQYPVELDLGSKVFVGASVQTFGNDMVLFADSCKAIPNPDPDASPQYQLIENSCGVDSTVDFDGQSTINKTSRVFFWFETFGFRDYSTVFVHCQLSVCNGSDVQCRRDCQQRGRRDVSAPNKLSDTIPIAIGPVILKRSDDDLDVVLDTKDSTSGGMFPALSTTLLFAACLVILAIACVLWIKSRANNRNSYQKLETNIDEM